MKCPECDKRMELHPTTCVGFYGNITEGKHHFCKHCNIEAFPDASYRRGR